MLRITDVELLADRHEEQQQIRLELAEIEDEQRRAAVMAHNMKEQLRARMGGRIPRFRVAS